MAATKQFAIEAAVIIGVGLIALSIGGCTTPTEPTVEPMPVVDVQIIVNPDGSWREYGTADQREGIAPLSETAPKHGAIRDPFRDTTAH